MLKVFICEDNNLQRNKFTNIIEKIIYTNDYTIKIEKSTSNPYEILDYLKTNKTCGIYFLDVILNSNINGIQLAEQIRHYDPRGFIVFITSHSEMSYLTFLYKVEALDYIIKDNYNKIARRIEECLKDATSKYNAVFNNSEKVFSLQINNKIVNVNFNDIYYFETSSQIHKVILHSTNHQVEFYSKMKDIEKRLDDRFCRCHNSFIVNKDKIKEIDKKNRIAHMINGDDCLISTRGIKSLINN